ncbi:ankyrin repeat domain-containing protein [Nocardia carnea]|uniref:ankyrin repeat domain-containing protein n=1 Tax=Nocardia carnea TaxID=37328 RepID=UPI002458E659|nr:ankyrin repeat domain-containing protein [Nocardia carnea]
MTNLINAVWERDPVAVEALLKAGASPEESSEEGTTPLYQAAVNGATDLVRLLLAHGADPNRPSAPVEEGLPLCAAACWNHAGVVSALLAAGADPDLPEPPHPQQQGPGTPPLLWAAGNGHLETVDLLLAAGADPNIAGTPLTRAARRGCYGIVRSLLAHGAEPGLADHEGNTAATIAADLVGADLIALLADQAGAREREYTVERTPAGDGTDRITLRYEDADGGGGAASIQDGHGAIAALLARPNDSGPADA